MSDSPPTLALNGGKPIRKQMLPYGRQTVSEEDVEAVAMTLRSDWLTTGPKVGELEEAFAAAVGARHAVAVSNGTAALHAAMAALEVAPGDEVIVPAVTFVGTANAVVFQGGTPIFCDVDPATLLIDLESLETRISSRTKAIVAVDYAGQPCDYETLDYVARRVGSSVVADACHALGASYREKSVGSLARLSTFSFHPVKLITTGEGGMITTDEAALASRMRHFRNHGITTDHRQRSKAGEWSYEMKSLGYNYRLTDIQCALGLSQLPKLPAWKRRRREIASRYDSAFSDLPGVKHLETRPHVTHAYHLYVLRLTGELAFRREEVFGALRAEGIGVNVHYAPVHLHPYYRERFGTRPGLCPVAEEVAQQVISLPIFPAMSDVDVEDVIDAVTKVTSALGN